MQTIPVLQVPALTSPRIIFLYSARKYYTDLLRRTGSAQPQAQEVSVLLLPCMLPYPYTSLYSYLLVQELMLKPCIQAIQSRPNTNNPENSFHSVHSFAFSCLFYAKNILNGLLHLINITFCIVTDLGIHDLFDGIRNLCTGYFLKLLDQFEIILSFILLINR